MGAQTEEANVNAGLAAALQIVAFHGLSINIKFRFRILYQPSLVLKHFEIFDTLIVNFFRVDIRSGKIARVQYVSGR